MALIIKDRVKEITTTTGTGAVSLAGASATFDTFQSVMSNGDTTFYAIVHTASGTDEWEVGLGTWNTGNTLTRTTVYAGSNGTSAVNFSSGNKDIFMTYPASKAAVAGEDVTFADVTATDITATGTVTLSGDPTSALHAASKEYVDTIAAAGIHYHTPVRVESPSNLNATYDNGSSGVGATLTNAGTQAALVIDGITLSTSDRVLVYNQTNAAHNGIYTVTNTGSASTNWVLTRATDADSYGIGDPDAFGEGDAFFVKEGNTGAGELYVHNTSGAITFGTTAINFTVIAETAVYSAGTGLTLTGTTFSTNQDISTSASPTFNNITVTGTVDGRDVATDGSKLDGIEAGATADQSAAEIKTAYESNSDTNAFTDAEQTKLSGIETGATGDQTASEILTAIKTVDGAGSNLDADLLDGQQGSYYLNTSTTFSGDVSGTYGAMVVADDSHNHVISNVDGLQTALDGKTTTSRTITAGDGLTGGGDFTANRTINVGAGSGITVTADAVSHADTSSQASVNNSNGTVIQDVTLDTYGHVTGLTSANLDGRYYTETEADSRFVNVTGDSMSGDLTLSSTTATINMGYNSGPHGINFYDDDSSLKWGFYYRTSPDSISFELNGSSNKWQLETNGDVTQAGKVYVDTNQRVFADNYHPNADKWTTARTLSLSGDASGSVSWDGSANATLSVSVGDADTVDSLHASSFLRSDADDTYTGVITGNQLHLGGSQITSSSAKLQVNGFQRTGTIYLHEGSTAGATNYALETVGSELRWNASKIWTAANDGSGSGLDADKLDGYHLSTTRNAANTVPVRDGNGYLQLGWINTTSGATSTLNKIYASSDSYIRYVTPATFRSQVIDGYYLGATAKAADSNLLDGIDSSSFLRSDTNDTSSGTLTANQLKVGSASGYFFNDSGSRTAFAGGDLYIQSISNYYNYATNQYHGNSSGDNHYFRGNTLSGTSWSLTGAGAASLQTLTLNGSVSSGATDYGYYQSSATNLILKGDSVGRSGIFFESEKDGTNINDPSDYGFIQFHSYGYGNTSGESNRLVIGVANDSTDEVVIQVPYSNGVKVGYRNSTSGTGLSLGTVWHSANDGAGSGLDADTLDGLHASYFVRNDTSQTLSGTTYTLGTSSRLSGNGWSIFAGGSAYFGSDVDINGNLNAVDNVYVAGAIYHEGDTDTNIWFGTNEMVLTTGGSSEITVNTTGVRLGDTGNGYFQPVSGNYGSIQIDGGAHGGYEGYSIGGRAVFMHNNSTRMGLYDDVNNAWGFFYDFGGAAYLTHSGSTKLSTSSTGISVTGTVAATSYTGDGSSLTGISAGATGGGSDEIFWENGQNVTSNYTITNGKNAMSAGPITVNSGVTVTVGSGETWTVV